MCINRARGNVDEGYRFGKLAQDIAQKLNSPQLWHARTTTIFYAKLHAWKKPIHLVAGPLLQAKSLSLRAGDVEFAMLASKYYCSSLYDIRPIPEIIHTIQAFRDSMAAHGQSLVHATIEPFFRHLKTMRGITEGQCCSSLCDANRQDYYEQLVAATTSNSYRWRCYSNTATRFMFGKYDEAASHLDCWTKTPHHSLDCGSVLFFLTMVRLTQVDRKRKKKLSLYVSLKLWHEIRKGVEQMKAWSQQCPENFSTKLYLLQAEVARIKQDDGAACLLFKTAISTAKSNGHMMSLALAYERFGKYLLDASRTCDGYANLRHAVNAYEEWGALGKVEHLQSEIEVISRTRSCPYNTDGAKRPKRFTGKHLMS